MNDQIENWLLHKGLAHTADHFKSRSDFKTSVTLQNARYDLVLHANIHRHFFGVYAYVPLIVNQSLHADVLEMIAAANWGKEFARFELNVTTGEFRCASTAYLADRQLNLAMIEGMTRFVLEWLDVFYPTLVTLNEQLPERA